MQLEPRIAPPTCPATTLDALISNNEHPCTPYIPLNPKPQLNPTVNLHPCPVAATPGPLKIASGPPFRFPTAFKGLGPRVSGLGWLRRTETWGHGLMHSITDGSVSF